MIIIKPVSPHFTFDKALILPSETKIELMVITSHESMLSIDGQLEIQLQNREEIIIKLSPYTARFLRIQPENYFYMNLDSKLNRKIL